MLSVGPIRRGSKSSQPPIALIGTLRRQAMHSTSPLLVDRTGAVLTLAINSPPMNRLTLEFMDEFERAIDAAARDDSVRALVITAAGDESFSVGMDLKQMVALAGDRART